MRKHAFAPVVDSGSRGLVLGSLLPGLQLGTSAAWSSDGADADARSDRLGADLRYARDALTLKGEAMRGWDGEVERAGYYLHAGYRWRDLEAIARYDVWDADTRSERTATDVTERHYLAGVNYYIAGPSAKLQANLIRRDFDGLLPARNLVLVNLQTAW